MSAIGPDTTPHINDIDRCTYLICVNQKHSSSTYPPFPVLTLLTMPKASAAPNPVYSRPASHPSRHVDGGSAPRLLHQSLALLHVELQLIQIQREWLETKHVYIQYHHY